MTEEKLELFENQSEGGTELSEDENEEEEVVVGEDTKEAQPSLEDATPTSRTGTIAGGATDGGSVEGGPASGDVGDE